MTEASDAKEIALHFEKVSTGYANYADIGRTINQAKILLAKHNKDDIIAIINYVNDVQKAKMYSLGYIVKVYDDVSAMLETIKLSTIERQKLEQVGIEKRNEVMQDDGHNKRNASKSNRFGTQSRFGEKPDFDLPT